MQNNKPLRIAVEPDNWRRETLQEVVKECGAELCSADDASVLVWVDSESEDIKDYLHPGIEWVQLPWAGIESFQHVLDNERQWTCGKGIYAEPVAEHVLAMTLACLHNLPQYAKASHWTGPVGKNLRDMQVLILGGGGITQQLLPLLGACGANSVVVRRKIENLEGARCVTMDALHDEIPKADIVVLALALTEETAGVIAAEQLSLMKDTAYIINVARGAHIVTDDLVSALQNNDIAGAALDVTDPEPLPDGHPLWALDNCLITPHVGNTPEMGIALLKRHIGRNIRRYMAGDALLGPVDVSAGY